MIWCEEIGKYGGVFIGGNGSVGYNHHKCGKKNVKNLTTVQKTYVHELSPPANVRELTHV